MLLDLIVQLWGDENPTRDVANIDLIVPISYGTKKDGLVNATRKTLEEAISYKKLFSKAVLVFGNCAYTFAGAEIREKELKESILRENAIEEYISASGINNTVEEAELIKKTLPFSPSRILLVTGEMHARSARFVWRRVFPNAKIIVRCIKHTYEYQKDQPIKVVRSGYKWFFANLARHLLLTFFGLRIRHLKHRAT